MALATLHTGIECIVLLTTQPREIAAVHRELLETRQDPTQHLVGIVTLGDNGNLAGVSTKESVLSCWAACKHVTIDDANALLCIVAVAKQSRELLAYQHINAGRVLNLATTQSYGTA